MSDDVFCELSSALRAILPQIVDCAAAGASLPREGRSGNLPTHTPYSFLPAQSATSAGEINSPAAGHSLRA